ncbi:MAG: WD40 repeat domain-containing protein, partial [Pirellulaceae bacterium]|nr:WD40 repeat domain-containing protein [Pirellulaceae bacterium]
AKVSAAAAQAAAAADAQAKTAEAAKPPLAKTATDTAQVAADAAQKALATNKPFTDAAAALTQAQNVHRAAEQARAFAARDLKLATDAVPVAKEAVGKTETLLQKLDSDLATAVQAETGAQQAIRAVAFSPDGQTLASGGDFGVVHTWDATSGQAVSSCAGHAGPIQALAYVDDRHLASASLDKQAVVWDLHPSWQLQRVIGDIADPSILADRVMAVDFSDDGSLLATGGGVPSRGGEVKIWKVADGTLARMLPEPHTDTVNSVAFSPDGLLIASAGADKYVKTFEVATGRLVMQFEGHTNHALGVDWRAGGKELASCGADGTIRIWNAENGDRVRAMEGFTRQVTSVRYVGQTQFLMATAGDPWVRKYNADNGGIQTNFGGPADYMYSVDATGDPNNGVVVAGGHDGVLRIWLAGGQTRHELRAPAPETAPSASDTQVSAP